MATSAHIQSIAAAGRGSLNKGARLRASSTVDRPPSSRYPYGYHRARSIAFLLAGLSIVMVAVFIVADGAFKLIQRHHPPIRSTEIFGATVWSGWLMLAALAFAAIPRAVLGRMKLPLDTCVWGGVKAELHAAGHDVLWSGDRAQDPGDEDILAWAHREQRVLITLDKGLRKSG